MQPTDEQLTSAFDKAMSGGPDHLVGDERAFYLIQDFILEWEQNGLSGYLYNRIPDFDVIRETVEAMRKHDFSATAEVMNDTLGLFVGYVAPTTPQTWQCVLERYAPGGTLDALDERISAIQKQCWEG